ncbi:MAG: HlyD family efflux transporter periplasmic adaptor subunit, partial [Bdellovibrionota bacterium]
MDRLRTIVEWIGAHKLVSFLVLALLSAAVYGSVYVSRANAGLLSDPIRNGDIIDAVYGIGTVSPYQRLSFNPLVGSTVQKNYVIEGDRVVKGAPLVQTAEAGLVRAPFDGAVNFLPYKAGENVYATTPLMILTDLTHLYIVVSIEQQGAL